MPLLSPGQVQTLAGAPVGRLSTASKSGVPHVIPVCFALDQQVEDSPVYIVLDGKPKQVPLARLRRVRNILENPRVALLVDYYDADWTKLWYILVTGAAEMLEGDCHGPDRSGRGTFEPSNAAHPEAVEGRDPNTERRRSIDLLRRKYPQYREMDIDENPVIKITPGRVVAWAYTPEPTP